MKKFITSLCLILLIAGCNKMNKDTSISEIKSGRATVKNAEIYFLEKGTGDTTLFFLHGWAINSSYWNDQLNYFGNNYKTVAIDLPGFGKSEANREVFTVEKYAEDVIHFIQKKELENVILIGHSMSGDVILETAIKNDRRIIGVVGIDNFKFVDVQISHEQKKEMDEFLSELEKDYKNIVTNYAENFLFSASTDTSVKNRVKNDYQNSDQIAAITSIKDVFNYEEAAKLERLNYKLYLINSDGLPTNTAGLDKFAHKSYKVLEISNVGHFPMIEKPDEFNKLLQQVINRISKE